MRSFLLGLAPGDIQKGWLSTPLAEAATRWGRAQGPGEGAV